MKHNTGFSPRVQVDASPSAVVGQAGAVLLTDTVGVSGLDVALTQGWRRGGSRPRCMIPRRSCWIWRCRWRSAGTASPMSRCFVPSRACSGPSPPTPTVSRLVDTLAADVTAALAAIDTARAAARAPGVAAGRRAGPRPRHRRRPPVDHRPGRHPGDRRTRRRSRRRRRSSAASGSTRCAVRRCRFERR